MTSLTLTAKWATAEEQTENAELLQEENPSPPAKRATERSVKHSFAHYTAEIHAAVN